MFSFVLFYKTFFTLLLHGILENKHYINGLGDHHFFVCCYPGIQVSGPGQAYPVGWREDASRRTKMRLFRRKVHLRDWLETGRKHDIGLHHCYRRSIVCSEVSFRMTMPRHFNLNFRKSTNIIEALDVSD